MLPFTDTAAPPAGAGDVSVTVAFAVLPAGTRAGLIVSDERLGGGGALPAGIKVTQACGAR